MINNKYFRRKNNQFRSLGLRLLLNNFQNTISHRTINSIRKYRLLQSYYSTLIKAFLILIPTLRTLISLVLSFAFCLSINLCDHNTASCDWDDQWIQKAPLNKQPDWFRNNQEDPRSLYEQMNGPAWRYIGDYYDLESGDPTYLGFNWQPTQTDSISYSSNESEDSSSDSDFVSNSYYEEVTLPQSDTIFSQLGEQLENVEQNAVIETVFTFIHEVIPLDFWSSNETDLNDFEIRANDHVISLIDENKNYTSSDIAYIVHYHTTLLAYNSAQLLGPIDLTNKDYYVEYTVILQEITETYIELFNIK